MTLHADSRPRYMSAPGGMTHRQDSPKPIQPSPSTAAIGGHPIHPMLIPFPMAFLTAAAGTDLAYYRTGDPFWSRASTWLLRAGLASGATAAVFGAIDFTTIDHARKTNHGWIHALGNVAALALSAANLSQRRDETGDGVVPNGLAMSLAVVGLLGVTGWTGGELSYRHGIGVDDSESIEPNRLAPPHEEW